VSTAGGDEAVVSSVYETVGVALVAHKKSAKGVELLEKSVDCRRRALSSNDPQIALSLRSLGEALVVVGEYGRAQEVVGEALAMLQSVGEGQAEGEIMECIRLLEEAVVSEIE